MYNLAKSSFIFSCPEPRGARSGDVLSTVAMRGAAFAVFREVSSGDEVSAPVFPMLPFSRSNLFRLSVSSYIYLPYLHTCFVVPTSRRRRRFAQLNTIRSVFLFFPSFIFVCLFVFFFSLLSLISRSPRARSINVYDAARSPSLFNSLFRVIV